VEVAVAVAVVAVEADDVDNFGFASVVVADDADTEADDAVALLLLLPFSEDASTAESDFTDDSFLDANSTNSGLPLPFLAAAAVLAVDDDSFDVEALLLLLDTAVALFVELSAFVSFLDAARSTNSGAFFASLLIVAFAPPPTVLFFVVVVVAMLSTNSGALSLLFSVEPVRVVSFLGVTSSISTFLSSF
jgi:hypothetical protein